MKENEYKKEIVKSIQGMSGRFTPYIIFSDWIRICALSIQNSMYMIHDDTWKKREKQFIETMEKYSDTEKKTLCKMYSLLTESFEFEMSDMLGEIYMDAGCGSKNTGQFFTPFHISYLTAQLGMRNDVSEDNILYMNEPSSGGGGMIIAAAKVLRDRGVNYQKCMDVNTKDLDWNGVYMTYIQLSILGIKATVTQGDSLGKQQTVEHERIFYTPTRMGVVL